LKPVQKLSVDLPKKNKRKIKEEGKGNPFRGEKTTNDFNEMQMGLKVNTAEGREIGSKSVNVDYKQEKKVEDDSVLRVYNGSQTGKGRRFGFQEEGGQFQGFTRGE